MLSNSKKQASETIDKSENSSIKQNKFRFDQPIGIDLGLNIHSFFHQWYLQEFRSIFDRPIQQAHAKFKS